MQYLAKMKIAEVLEAGITALLAKDGNQPKEGGFETIETELLKNQVALLDFDLLVEYDKAPASALALVRQHVPVPVPAPAPAPVETQTGEDESDGETQPSPKPDAWDKFFEDYNGISNQPSDAGTETPLKGIPVVTENGAHLVVEAPQAKGWTPERRAAQSARMREKHAGAGAGKNKTVSAAQEEQEQEQTQSQEVVAPSVEPFPGAENLTAAD